MRLANTYMSQFKDQPEAARVILNQLLKYTSLISLVVPSSLLIFSIVDPASTIKNILNSEGQPLAVKASIDQSLVFAANMANFYVLKNVLQAVIFGLRDQSALHEKISFAATVLNCVTPLTSFLVGFPLQKTKWPASFCFYLASNICNAISSLVLLGFAKKSIHAATIPYADDPESQSFSIAQSSFSLWNKGQACFKQSVSYLKEHCYNPFAQCLRKR